MRSLISEASGLTDRRGCRPNSRSAAAPCWNGPKGWQHRPLQGCGRLLFFTLLGACGSYGADFQVLGDSEPWARILRSVGFVERAGADTAITVVRAGGEVPADVLARIDSGGTLILEGASPTGEMLGFRPAKKHVRAAGVGDRHQPKLRIVWERALELPVFRLPDAAIVFAKERWSGAPLVAGLRRGKGAILWTATSPGERGYDRYPYLLQALSDLGVRPPVRSSRLWAFFDYSYRMRADPEYLADKWVDAGIAAIHVGAWHFHERDPERDRYLERLISACHERAIAVYAWLELPHVSERFWESHPEWREKTGLLQDAQLDWRKLMNLQNRDCFREVRRGIEAVIGRFDWDGVNLAELYFESLHGIDNPARFTPMNDDVRARYRRLTGRDPLRLVREKAPGVKDYLEFRAELAREMQEEWLDEVERMRSAKPHLDLVLTHVDDRFDPGMKAAIGADAARMLPLLEKRSFTFLVEDPATVWHLGSNRYREIARRYAELTPRRDRLAIDINIVERYQNVYPTKQQTGIELLDLVHTAAASFPRVALYFENSILAADRDLLSASAAVVTRLEKEAGGLVVDSPRGVGLRWAGDALVDGRLWPVSGAGIVWLPQGRRLVQAAAGPVPLRIARFGGDLRGARTVSGGVEVAYESQSRAFAVLERPPASVEVDGHPLRTLPLCGPRTVILPRGQHVVTIR